MLGTPTALRSADLTPLPFRLDFEAGHFLCLRSIGLPAAEFALGFGPEAAGPFEKRSNALKIPVSGMRWLRPWTIMSHVPGRPIGLCAVSCSSRSSRAMQLLEVR